jgi:hypothetical protein
MTTQKSLKPYTVLLSTTGFTEAFISNWFRLKYRPERLLYPFLLSHEENIRLVQTPQFDIGEPEKDVFLRTK